MGACLVFWALEGFKKVITHILHMKLRTQSVIVLLLFLFAISFAQVDIFVNATHEGLIASVNQTTIECRDSPCIGYFSTNITNENDSNASVFFAEKVDDKWHVITDLGPLPANTTSEFRFSLKFEYSGTSNYVGHYALLTSDMLRYEFTITEGWQKYETATREALLYGAFLVAPTVAIVLLFILFLVERSAARTQIQGAYPGEYTTKTLFQFPSGGTVGERLAVLISNPIIWAVVLFFMVALIGIIALTTYKDIDFITLSQVMVVSFVAAFAVPLLLMIATWYGDIFEREPLRFVVGMFVWGILAAFLAFFFNAIFIAILNKSGGALPLLLVTVFGSIIISPVVEESLKGIGVLVMSRHHQLNDTLDGLLYGFAIGVGFAAVENWFYFVSQINPLTLGLDTWLAAILYRSFFNTLAHGCFTAFIGALIGTMKSKSRFAQYSYLAFFPGLLIAIVLHMVFNFSAILDIVAISAFRMTLVLFNPSLVLVVAIGFIVIYAYGLIETKRRKEKEVPLKEMLVT